MNALLDSEGFSTYESCRALRKRFRRVSRLYNETKKLGYGSKLRFLQIRGNGETLIEESFGRTESSWTETYTKELDCDYWFTPPRFIQQKKLNSLNIVFCVVRDPLMRALSNYVSLLSPQKIKDWHKLSPELMLQDAEEWLVNIPTRKPGKYNCRLVPQYQYVWDSDGERTCNHVFRYEDGIAAAYNRLLQTYQLSKKQLSGIVSDLDTKQQMIFDALAGNISQRVESVVHAHYAEDYCLLGYHSSRKTNIWSRPESVGSLNNTLILDNSHNVVNTSSNSSRNSEDITAPLGAASDEALVPTALYFDEHGLPSPEACNDIRFQYEGSKDLFVPSRRLSGRELTFLHIPKTAGSTIEDFFGRFDEPAPEKYLRGADCASSHNSTHRQNAANNIGANTACECNYWHIPPRYWIPNPYADKAVFCVVREPLERLLSELRMRQHIHIDRHPEGLYDPAQWLMQSYLKEGGDKDCHYVPQFEYVWDERGRRTCHHVIMYERGIERSFNALLDLYGIASPLLNHNSSIASVVGVESNDTTGVGLQQGQGQTPRRPRVVARMPEVMDSTLREKSFTSTFNTSEADIPAHVAAAVRRLYWRDYCLLGDDYLRQARAAAAAAHGSPPDGGKMVHLASNGGLGVDSSTQLFVADWYGLLVGALVLLVLAACYSVRQVLGGGVAPKRKSTAPVVGASSSC